MKEGVSKNKSKNISKNIFLTYLFGSQYSFEIHYTSLPIKNSENVVKNGCLEKGLLWRAQISF